MYTRCSALLGVLIFSVVLGFQARSSAMEMPVGSLIMYAGEECPDGFLFCDGRLMDNLEHPELYAAIGNLYGPAKDENGVPLLTPEEQQKYPDRAAWLHLFRLPDLRGRFARGAEGPDAGVIGGEAEHRLTAEEMPSHRHGTETFSRRGWPKESGDRVKGGVYYFIDNAMDKSPIETANTMLGIKESGADKPHNNLPPFLMMNFIIKY